MRTCNVTCVLKTGRIGFGTILSLPATGEQEPRWNGRLDHSGICASIKGGTILERMVTRKTICLRRLGGSRRGEEQAGRFFANPKVTAAKIVEGWSELTGPAVAGLHVLAIQDTTEVKFPTTAQRRRGLGPVKKGNAYGVVAHAMIAVDADSHACLGLVGGDVHSRDGVVTEHHRDRPLSERESRRWIETAERAKEVLASAAMVTPAFALGESHISFQFRSKQPSAVNCVELFHTPPERYRSWGFIVAVPTTEPCDDP